jgi:hypothetical protein
MPAPARGGPFAKASPCGKSAAKILCSVFPDEVAMAPPTPEEKAALAEAPRGTYVLMLLVAVVLFAGWAILYFGRFLGAGPVR